MTVKAMRVERPNLTATEIWRIYDRLEQRLTAPLSERMLELANLRPGMRVLDLATGRGEPAIRAAHRVGPTGRVLGVDNSEEMLQFARERGVREGLANLDLLAANAESLDGIPSGHFDVTLVRWGLMYLESPVAALTAARKAMVAHGRLVAAVWAEPERAPYFSFPRQVLRKYREVPPIDQLVPGPFRYADQNLLSRDFTVAGFSIEHIEEQEVPVMEAATSEELITWVRAFVMRRLLEGLSDEIQSAWENDLLDQAESFRDDGYFRLGGVTRIVVASAAP